MLTTSCPSCASPLTFTSGAALTAICPACQSCVVREGDVVRDYGKVARFQRDLSPIRVDARGKVGTRDFRVAGVLRKGRDRVRWNEWYIRFDDGEDGWIGEGNGQWFVYAETASVAAHETRGVRAGESLSAGGGTFRVMEAGEAAVLAAEGELPGAIWPDRPTRYLDLREEGGARVGTVDFADAPPTLWLGRDVTLVQLQMEGLRPFAGWSDPALVHFAGPEITEVRALRCDACGASNAVRAPGQAQRLACAYCGSVQEIDASEANIQAELLDRRTAPPFAPRIPVGTRGTLRGIDWVAIGAMVREVHEEGVAYAWTEYLLHNPYRGFAWLVQDTQSHWSFVEPLRGELPQVQGRLLRWRDSTFTRFAVGTASVRHVLGEFTWEVAVGDRAETQDFIDPPRMLSCERTADEITWSVGTWLPVAEVEAGFKADMRRAEGVAPHQPNPHRDAGYVRAALLRGTVLAVLATVLLVLALVLPSRERVLSNDLLVVAGDNAWVTEPIRLDDAALVEFAVASSMPSDPDVMISFIHAESGEVWDWTTYGTSSANARLSAGTWTGRVALPVAAPDGDAGASLRLTATRGPGFTWPAVVLFLFACLGPVAWFVDSNGFETRRWLNANGNT